MKQEPALVFLVVFVAAICWGAQASNAPKKQAKKAEIPPSVQPAPFVCPDPEAKQSCKSYEELVKAKDKDLPGVFENSYVCFRKGDDEFFILAFSPPYFEETWNDKYKKMMIDPKATSDGSGYATSYKDGVEDSRIMPSLNFEGTWRRSIGRSVFSSTEVNPDKSKPDDEPSLSVYIGESQLSITHKYQNPMKQDILYSLTIQRSTGRFAESFQKATEQIPFSHDTGRCVYLSAE